MKGFGFRAHGDCSNMEILDFPMPTPGPGEVLVELKASAFNHLDIWVCKGWPGLKLALPHISGSDGAGIVSKLGEQVNTVSIGQRVAINPGINAIEDEFTERGEQSVSPGFQILGEQLPGTHTEYVSVPAKNLIVIPHEISFVEAAAAGLVSLTAWRMLIHRAKIKPGQRVLINGAGGGVNSISIQIAKYAGCTVYATTSSPQKMKQAMQLGAHSVVNYKDDLTWEKKLFESTQKMGFDVVVDNVGRATLASSLRLVKRGGCIVIVGNTQGPLTELDIRYLFSKQISLLGSTMGNQNDYREAMKLI